jgi:hypothetical protein
MLKSMLLASVLALVASSASAQWNTYQANPQLNASCNLPMSNNGRFHGYLNVPCSKSTADALAKARTPSSASLPKRKTR